MENSERLKKMRRLAYRLSNDLINEKHAIGVLLSFHFLMIGTRESMIILNTT